MEANVLKTKILLILIFTVILNAAEVVEDRNTTTSHDIMLGSKPSDIPTGGLVKDFKPMNKNLFTDVDISSNPEAKLFAGYGVYDLKNENCVYVDAPSSDGSLADSKFMEFKVYNDHMYGVSINEMTYATCQAETVKYNGYPVVISTEEENNAISQYFKDYDKWIGAQRNGPCPAEYIDSSGSQLLYNGFYVKADMCKDTEPNVLIEADKQFWNRGNTTRTAKCIIEFNSTDWKKPLKTCAPWWSIERTYLAPETSKYLVQSVDKDGNVIEIDIRDFNQKDFPKTVKVCTNVDANASSNAFVGTQEVFCNSYYDRTASPICADNPQQSLCKVDECRGAIKNKCNYISSGPAPLTYSKEPVFINGEYKLIRKKVDIEIHKYVCPVNNAVGDCLEMKTVTMLPQPCPGTYVDSNGTEQKPIKVYGSAAIDGPNKYDASGNLVNLYGMCPDGTKIEIPVNIIEQNTRVCTRYATVTDTKEYDQMCIADKGYTDHTVLASATEQDAFDNDPSCIRINNIIEARPNQDVRVDYETFGMANLAIVKAEIDGGAAEKYETLLPSTYYQTQLANMPYTNTSQNGGTASDADLNVTGVPVLECSAYDNGGPYRDTLKEYIEKEVQKVYDTSVGRIFDFGTIDKNTCAEKNIALNTTPLWGTSQNNATVIEQMNTEYENSYMLLSTTGISADSIIDPNVVDASNTSVNTTGRCVGVSGAVTIDGDFFNYVEISLTSTVEAPNIELWTENTYDYESCREMAACAGYDILNNSNYAGNEICKLRLTNTSGDAAMNEIKEEVDAEIQAQLDAIGDTNDYSQAMLDERSDSGTLTVDQINGLQDIYAIMEYTDFNFGYFSSYSSRNFKSNTVKINGLIVNPIAEHTKIEEHLSEDYTWDYTTYRNYEVNSVGQNTMFVGAGGGVGNVNALTAGLLISTGGGLAAMSYLYNAFFGSQLITFEGSLYTVTYGYLDPSLYRYVENPYGYETREVYQKPGENFMRIKYMDMAYSTNPNRYEMSSQGVYFDLWKDKKTAFYKELNIDMENYVWPEHDTKVMTPSPSSCKWYNPWCKKTNHAEGAGTLDPTKYHTRPLTVHYMGATNTVAIVVPYKGDYVVEAYNRIGVKLGEFIAYDDAFVTNITSDGEQTMSYVQIKFGEVMDLTSGLNGNPCRTDLMAEVGGGVSGAYYELGKTSLSSNFYCSKSNDQYVIDNSIVKLKVRSLSQSDFFAINLKKPMPYVNRIFLTTMGLDEERVYRCYDSEYPECIGFERIASEN